MPDTRLRRKNSSTSQIKYLYTEIVSKGDESKVYFRLEVRSCTFLTPVDPVDQVECIISQYFEYYYVYCYYVPPKWLLSSEQETAGRDNGPRPNGNRRRATTGSSNEHL